MILQKPNILLLYTGGTIGMMKDFETGALKTFDFSKLLKKIPELKLLDCHIQTISFENPIDSSNMNTERWVQIASIIEENYYSFDGFVVLHGSDTMSYSASALSFMLENLDKPIIFTGSQLPIGDLRTDAKENLITAIQLAALQQKGKPAITEVGLYFEYKLYRGNRTTKINTEHFNAFASPNFPPLAESGVHLKITPLPSKTKTKKQLIVHKKLVNDVVIVKMFPGISEKILSSIFNIPNLKGIILETYGSGNAPTDEWLIQLLKNTIKKNIPIVNVTQCLSGSVHMGSYETSTQLKKIGVISGNDITTESAITKMMFLLGQNSVPTTFKAAFETPLRGEMQ